MKLGKNKDFDKEETEKRYKSEEGLNRSKQKREMSWKA